MINHYKNKRIVNINVNIILAGIFSTLLAAYPVYLTHLFTDDMGVIIFISFIADAVLDFLFFGFFHWMTHFNHSKKIVAMDFALIQSHRIVLSILYYVLAGSIQFALMHAGFYRTPAFIIAYIFALGITRMIHTWYGLRTGLFKRLN